MNLKEWYAMSPEEQREYWEKASGRERRELWGHAAGSGIEFVKAFEAPTMSCSAALRSLKGALDKQVDDEKNAGGDYRKIGELAADAGLPAEAMIFEALAVQEQTHRTILEAIIHDIDEVCG